ncbi:MAG: hypothetical protein IRZ20_02850 [Thermoleophilia bacterium]|nr:hypothetical protein [Thermoleophilia bacterium]
MERGVEALELPLDRAADVLAELPDAVVDDAVADGSPGEGVRFFLTGEITDFPRLLSGLRWARGRGIGAVGVFPGEDPVVTPQPESQRNACKTGHAYHAMGM